MRAGKIGTADVTDKERVAGEDLRRAAGVACIREQDADAFEGMTGSLKEAEGALAEANLLSVTNCFMVELSPRAGAEIDAGAGAVRELMVTGDEVGVEMRFD